MPVLKKVTMQDIADACGLSRNTVSKIFNKRGAVPEATRDFVLSKARELGYYQPTEQAPVLPSVPRNVALLTHSRPSLHNFGSLFITNFTDQICRTGFNLKVFEISDDGYRNQQLPSHFNSADISGIITLELFDRDYTKMVCSLGLPVLLVDSYPQGPHDLMCCDLVYMENLASTYAMTSRMIGAGAKTLGFVGDIRHCHSFLDRWHGFRAALDEADIALDKNLCILADDSEPYGELDWIVRQLDKLPEIPDAFVCCNDFVAIRIMQGLRKKGLSVPEDVMVTGFDGTPEAEVVYPPLTTAKIPSAELGRMSADILLSRIADPTLPYRSTFVKTTPIWRESTRD